MITVHSRGEQNQIILTGFMGTGKTAVGLIVAKRLGRSFLDTDQLVEQKAGLSIPDIFERHGEEHFRDLETETLRDLAACEPGTLVIATGGGAVLREDNRRLLKKLGPVFLLRATAEEIYRRISKTGTRPLFNTSDPARTIAGMLKEREPCYRDCNYVIDTTARLPSQVASKIISCLNHH